MLATKTLSFTPCPADATDLQLKLAVGRAYAAWKALKDRAINPDGEFDPKGRWEPSDDERRECCRSIRSPSVKWPYTILKHCRSVEHVAARFAIPATLLRKRIARENPRPAVFHADHYKAVAMLDDGRLVSVYDGVTEYRLGETLREPCRPGHRGGYYCHPDVEMSNATARRLFPDVSALYGCPRLALIRVRVGGRKIRYSGGKVAFSSVTPVEVVRVRKAVCEW